MQTPNTKEEWLSIADDFEKKWNYPCCIGAIDGKHFALQQPNKSGSEFFNYKHFFSVLLLAVVDANYKFLYVDVGSAGRVGDAGVFSSSTLKGALDKNTLDIPSPCLLGEDMIHYHLIGDDAFPMSVSLLKPYPYKNMDREKRIFNYRLSRARRVVENAFGILANRFRVFHTKINLSPDKVTDMVLATCCLHNFLVENSKSYTSICDSEDLENCVTANGAWRSDPPLSGLTSGLGRNPSRNAKEQRQFLTDYFSSNIGSVSWQEKMI